MTKKAEDMVNLPLTCCDKCTHCDLSRYCTADSFEEVTAWNCKHPEFTGVKNGSRDWEEWKTPPGIARLDWNDPKPAIPKWCPLRNGKSKS